MYANLSLSTSSHRVSSYVPIWNSLAVPQVFHLSRVSRKGKSSRRGSPSTLGFQDNRAEYRERAERKCIAINYLTKAARPLRLHYVGQLVAGAFHGVHSLSANGDRLAARCERFLTVFRSRRTRGGFGQQRWKIASVDKPRLTTRSALPCALASDVF